MTSVNSADMRSLSQVQRAAPGSSKDHTPQSAIFSPRLGHKASLPCARLKQQGDSAVKFGSSPLSKAAVIALLAVLMLIPLQMLTSLVKERVFLREQAVASVSHGWGGRQTLGGLVVAI